MSEHTFLLRGAPVSGDRRIGGNAESKPEPKSAYRNLSSPADARSYLALNLRSLSETETDGASSRRFGLANWMRGFGTTCR